MQRVFHSRHDVHSDEVGVDVVSAGRLTEELVSLFGDCFGCCESNQNGNDDSQLYRVPVEYLHSRLEHSNEGLDSTRATGNSRDNALIPT